MRYSDGKRQQGAVLAVALIILLALTLIGITGMQTTTLEEKMAGNLRDQNVAFQAAEAALRDGEDLVDGSVSTAAFDGTNGLYGSADSPPDYSLAATWTGTNSRAYTGSIPGATTAPRYFIQHLGAVSGTGGALNVRRYGGLRPNNVDVFRITARGTGGSNNSQVVLQTHFGKRF